MVFGTVVVVMVLCNFMPGFRSWIPNSCPSTVTRALSGMLAKCRRDPSSILTTRSFPLTETTSPRSTCVSVVACPLVLLDLVFTCASTATLINESMTAAAKQNVHVLVVEFIFRVLLVYGLVRGLAFRTRRCGRTIRHRTNNRCVDDITLWRAAYEVEGIASH